jgi:histidinol-phosphatase (PHP family)
MLIFDDHLHSHFSYDGRESISDLCHAAVQRGLAGVTITDHFDTDPSDPGYGRYDYDRIRREVEQARDRYGDRLSILLGAEVCFQPAFTQDIVDFVARCPLDFVLGGVHYVRREFVDGGYFTRHDVDEAYWAYFEAVEAAVQSGLFDSIAHLDMPKRHSSGPFDPRRYWAQIEHILQLMVERGTGLEINSKGWREVCAEPFPGEAILRRYAELGGERITIGADGHRAAHLGCSVGRACDLARRLGFTHATRFVQRWPQHYPL